MSPRSLVAIDIGGSLPLLGPSDAPPLIEVNAGGRMPVLLVCDHAARAFPARLTGRLGLPEEALDRHIAWDIGAAAVTRRLAGLLDAPALLASYSRLVIDLNRGLDEPTLIPEVSDGTVISGNLDLSPADREARIEALYRPWHRAVASSLQRLAVRHGRPPVLIGIHSFTPVMNDRPRPWHVGVLWHGDDRIAGPLMAALAADGDLCVGDNQPYSALVPAGGTLETHALAVGRPGVSIEIRQDLLACETDRAAWAERLAGVLKKVLPACAMP